MYRKGFNDNQIGIRGKFHLPTILSVSLTTPRMSRLTGWLLVICNFRVYSINVTSGGSNHDIKREI